jgi:hypothetical protein
MHRHFLPLLTAFVLAAFASFASANDFVPKPGFYASTSGSAIHVSFELTRKGTIINLRIQSRDVVFHGHPNSEHTFSFHKARGKYDDRLTPAAYSGHGVWEAADICRGDFRYYKDHSYDTNVYHRWHAHWVRDNFH